MSSPVEQIKARLSIVDVISGYLKLEKAGTNFKAICPFHSEKTPSFHVSPARDSYYCFGCNRGGDIFTFVEEMDGLTFPETLKLFAERTGVVLENQPREHKGEKDRLYAILDAAREFYRAELVHQSEAYGYLKDRGLTDQTITEFDIGFAPDPARAGWRAIESYLREKGYADREIENAGLIKQGEKGVYDRFRSRIMFPINDPSGRTVAFSGRIFGDETGPDGAPSAKYINSPETELYDKSSILFGFDRAKQHIRKQNFTIIVEGQMDLLAAHQAGTKNTVAVSGTALTDKHLKLLKRLSDNLIFAFDADEAGINATARAFSLALSLGMSVRVATMPEGKDPSDVVKRDPHLWVTALKDSKHIIDFLMSTLSAKYSEPRAFRKAVENRVLPLVNEIPSRIERAQLVIEIARKLGVPETAVGEELKRLALAAQYADGAYRGDDGREEAPARIPAPARKTSRMYAEEAAHGMILWQESHKAPTIDVIVAKKRLADIYERHEAQPEIDTASRLEDLIFRAEAHYDGKEDIKLGETLDELLASLEKEVLNERQEKFQRELAAAEEVKDAERTQKALAAIMAINARRKILEDEKLGAARDYEP